ncbi:MAG: response regulator [Bacteroidota bacterium]
MMNLPKDTTTILLVDDEINILLALEFLLAQAGYRVLTAQDGPTALQTVQEHRPDIAVLDVMMPGMNGFQLAEALRAQTELLDLRVVFLTARSQPEDRTQGYRSGGEVYLTKPFDNQELLTVIEEMIQYG